MSRRPLVLLALVISSLVISACSGSSLTEPRHEDVACKSGVWTGSGCS